MRVPDPIVVWTRVLNATPPRYRPFVRALGQVVSWIILLESAGSILLGRAIVRDFAASVYGLSGPYIQEILIGLWRVLEFALNIWRAIINPPLEALEQIIGIRIPNAVVELLIIFLFAWRSYFLIKRRSRVFEAVTQNLGRTLSIKQASSEISIDPYLRQKLISHISRSFNEPSKVVKGLRDFVFIEVAKEDVSTSSKGYRRRNANNVAFDFTKPGLEIAETEPRIVHAVGYELALHYERIFRLAFIEASYIDFGFEVYNTLPSKHSVKEDVFPFLFFDYCFRFPSEFEEGDFAMARLNFCNLLSIKLRDLIGDTKAPELSWCSNEVEAGAALNRAHKYLVTASKEYDFLKMSKQGINFESSISKRIVTSYFVLNVLRKDFMSYGRRSRFGYAVVSFGTFIIFVLDILIYKLPQ